MFTPVSTYLINGRHEALSPLDRGFSYGDGVFRTFAIRLNSEKSPSIWATNYQKLVSDCRVLGIVCPNAKVLFDDMSHLLAANELAVIKIIITRGEGARGYTPPAIAVPNRVVIKSALPSYPIINSIEGITLRVCDIRLPQQPKLAGIKHLNKLENVLAKMEWQNSEITDGILLDTDNRVIECTSSNIFVRSGTILTTPDLSQCGVAGVTRQRIIELAPSLGLTILIKNILLTNLLQAEEVLVCNSLINAWQVTRLNDKHWQTQALAAKLSVLLQA